MDLPFFVSHIDNEPCDMPHGNVIYLSHKTCLNLNIGTQFSKLYLNKNSYCITIEGDNKVGPLLSSESKGFYLQNQDSLGCSLGWVRNSNGVVWGMGGYCPQLLPPHRASFLEQPHFQSKSYTRNVLHIHETFQGFSLCILNTPLCVEDSFIT